MRFYVLQIMIVLSLCIKTVEAQTFDSSNLFNNNLLSNGDFRAKDPEQRPLHWVTGKGLQTAVITTEQRHDPEKDGSSLRMDDSSDLDYVMVRSEKHIANPGTLYIARAWVKGRIDSPATFYLEFWNQNAKRISTQSFRASLDTQWRSIAIQLIAPDSVTHVSVAIGTGVTEKSVSYWDDISLTPQIFYNQSIKTGSRELFIDNYRIESMVDVQRIVNPPVKSKPLIVADKPWEGKSVYIYGTVLKDEPAGSGYRMWYTAMDGENYYLCYATSDDGIRWKKPHVGIIEYKGNKNNNICKRGGGSLIFDPFDVDKNRRYKLMTVDGSGSKWGYWVYFSPDGLKWTPYASNPVLPYGDVATVAYDKSRRLFIAVTKQRMYVSNTSATPNKMDRAAFLSVSKDFVHWSAPGISNSIWTLAVEGDPADDLTARSKNGIEAQIYGMPVYPYEGNYIGFPWVFYINNYTTGIYAVTGDGPIQPQISVSRDLRHWSRPSRDPILPLSNAGAWDDGTIYTANTINVSDKDVQLYYGGMNLPHGATTSTLTQQAKIAKATWRRDGFVSLSNAGDDPGVITTKKIVFNGRQLKVNAKLNPFGSLKVEIVDDTGNPIPGYTRGEAIGITGNHLSTSVIWKKGSSIKKLAGKEIKFRFYLKGGDLFSYWITN